MKILPTELSSKGFTYRQVQRVGNVAVYSQHDHPLSVPGAYEVIIIKSHDGYTLMGNYVAPAEMYPSAGLFGKIAWSYSCHLYPDALQKALDKATQVAQSEDIKQANSQIT